MPSYEIMKYKILILSILIGYAAWTQLYRYDSDKAVAHIQAHHLSRSHSCCAWYVMRAMQAGGCPIGILPAWAYKYALPLYGFKQVEKPAKGDIVVIENTPKHFWGHIAMYDGEHWISDFKQKSISVYRDMPPYMIYRK